MTRPIVTLLTDFGETDYFVGAMKGTILAHDPEIVVVDLSHHIARHDVQEAAFFLSCVYRDFPPGTVHVVVVDPGVGSDRRAITVEAAGQRFVGPDNGTFSYVIEREGTRDARVIEAAELMRSTVGATFHGRDIFAPAAAALVRGFPMSRVGRRLEDPVMLAPIRPERLENGSLRGRILHVDHFGNCVTSLMLGDLGDDPRRFRFRLRGASIEQFRGFFADGDTESLFVIQGSAGFLEISMNRGSAAAGTGARRGDEVIAEPR